ncbi:MAG: hypothetical protein IIC75_00310 [Bacteroidetes bacterium]|nr:hypothetical protein [Bacteroidota bacterium]
MAPVYFNISNTYICIEMSRESDINNAGENVFQHFGRDRSIEAFKRISL